MSTSRYSYLVFLLLVYGFSEVTLLVKLKKFVICPENVSIKT